MPSACNFHMLVPGIHQTVEVINNLKEYRGIQGSSKSWDRSSSVLRGSVILSRSNRLARCESHVENGQPG